MDPEGFTMVSSISTTGTLPISLSASEVISVAPTSFSHVGPHTIVVTLTDACGGVSTSNLLVLVANTAPYFTVPSYIDIVASMNEIKTFTMSDFLDAEGNPVSLALKEYSFTTGALLATAPSFATIVPGSSF